MFRESINKNITKEIGKKVLVLRKKRQMTRDQLAEKINISRQQLFKYEMGLNKITVERLVAISSVLNFDINNFLPEARKNQELSLIIDNESSGSFPKLEEISAAELIDRFMTLLIK